MYCQILINFTIGRYTDQVLCDIVLIQARHLLLGRPWQFDAEARHEGKSNRYHLVKDGKAYILAPFPLIKVCKFQIQHRERQIEWCREKELQRKHESIQSKLTERKQSSVKKNEEKTESQHPKVGSKGTSK